MNRQQRRAAAKSGAPAGGGAAAPGGGLFAEAVRHHRAGRLQAAHAICRQLLALDPGHRDALHLDGLIACQLGAPAEGIALLEKALARGARDPALHANLAEALRSLARLDEAALHYRRAVALAPNFAAAHAGMGHVLLQQGRHDEAAAAYGRALALAPGQAAVLNNLGVALHRLGRLDEAAAAFGQALDADPGHLDALTNRGNLLLALGRGDAALASYERALALNPDHPAALNNRADLLVERGRFAEAAAAFERLLAIAPNYPYALGSLLYARLHRCDWSDFERLAAGAAEAAAAGRPVATPSALVCLSDSAAAQLACARIFAADKHPAAAQPLWRGERYAHQRIRVAYISADFRRHPVGYLVAGLFAAHDRARFAITALSTGPDAKDDLRARFEASAERFVDVRGRSEREVAQLVRELEIDIAVDLTGYTAHARTGILAYRPAPVQVNFLGYPGTLGADYVDYLVADRFVVPEDCRRFYAEQVVYLPDTYQPRDDALAIAEPAPSRAEAGLPEHGFVFCCFNSLHKITPPVFAIWMRLLHRVAGSVLWLLEGEPAAMAHLRDHAAAHGVAGERLVFAPRQPIEQHLARHRCADLFLDTLPYNAHTTASDALWAGLPLLTCAAPSGFAGRVAGSLLHAAGLPELVTFSLADYEALARRLADEPQRLRALREKLGRARKAAPLFDTARFCRHLEQAYDTMSQRRQRGEPPAAFAL